MATTMLGASTTTKCSILGAFHTSVASTANQLLFHNKSSLNQPSLARALPSSAKPNLNVSTIGLKFPSGSIFRQCQHSIHCWTSSESGIEGNDGITPALLERPAYVPKEDDSGSGFFGPSDKDEDVVEEEQSCNTWVDWEDVILKDILPLKGLVRTILHSDWYTSGQKLIRDHEIIILEKLLPYHPDLEEKVGCGVDFLTVDNHPDFENSRCLFIHWIDGGSIDFSYWKCLIELVRKKYPLYAEAFIQKHLTRRSS